MIKMALAVAAALTALSGAPFVAPAAKVQYLRLAQGVDIQLERDDDDRYRGRGRRGNDADATVGIGPDGVRVGPGRRQNCRIVTTRVERDDGRIVTRQRERCD
jgi:hypothetical protein